MSSSTTTSCKLPVVVGEGGAYSLDPVDVAGQSIDGPGPAHLLGDELAELIEAVLVAAGEVALVQGGYVSALESHVGHGHTVEGWCTKPAASAQGACLFYAARRVEERCAHRETCPESRAQPRKL